MLRRSVPLVYVISKCATDFKVLFILWSAMDSQAVKDLLERYGFQKLCSFIRAFHEIPSAALLDTAISVRANSIPF